MFMDFLRSGLLDNNGINQNQTGSSLGNVTSLLLPLVAMIAIFYFLIYRPNKKKEKQKREMLDSMKKGDRLTTIGGIQGRIAQIKDESIVIEVANLGEAEKVKIEIQKWAIGTIESSESAD